MCLRTGCGDHYTLRICRVNTNLPWKHCPLARGHISKHELSSVVCSRSDGDTVTENSSQCCTYESHFVVSKWRTISRSHATTDKASCRDVERNRRWMHRFELKDPRGYPVIVTSIDTYPSLIGTGRLQHQGNYFSVPSEKSTAIG